MEFFRKVKNFVTGQSEPGTSTSSGASASTTVPQTRAAVTYRQPVLQNAGFGTAGGVQGLDWYKAKLKQDRDGDVADEFLLERSDKSTQQPDKGLQVDSNISSHWLRSHTPSLPKDNLKGLPALERMLSMEETAKVWA